MIIIIPLAWLGFAVLFAVFGISSATANNIETIKTIAWILLIVGYVLALIINYFVSREALWGGMEFVWSSIIIVVSGVLCYLGTRGCLNIISTAADSGLIEMTCNTCAGGMLWLYLCAIPNVGAVYFAIKLDDLDEKNYGAGIACLLVAALGTIPVFFQ